MTPEFSRRAAKALNSLLFINMSPEERDNFVDVCSAVETFDDLPQEWKDKIVESEQHIA